MSEEVLLGQLQSAGVGLICLAGYLKVSHQPTAPFRSICFIRLLLHRHLSFGNCVGGTAADGWVRAAGRCFRATMLLLCAVVLPLNG